jgi:hypothetical protein
MTKVEMKNFLANDDDNNNLLIRIGLPLSAKYFITHAYFCASDLASLMAFPFLLWLFLQALPYSLLVLEQNHKYDQLFFCISFFHLQNAV